MPPDSAALLTKTQRQRIRDQFVELDNEKTRRDQQRIRQRIAAGTEDFSLLVNYPDEQFRMAFNDYSDEELLDVLADGHLVLERVREDRDLDREQIVKRARKRALNEANETTDVATLDRLDFETATERRHRLVAEIQEELSPSVWDQRANRLLHVAAGTLFPVFLMGFFDYTIGTIFLTDYNVVAAVLGYVSALLVVCALVIKSAKMMKYDIIPPVHTLVVDPGSAFSTLYSRIISNPIQTLRRSWDNL